MRLSGRHISRDEIFAAADSYQVVESYPDDKHLPSYLVLGRHAGAAFHVLFAVDFEDDHVRVITAYRPNLSDWEPDLRTRRAKT